MKFAQIHFPLIQGERAFRNAKRELRNEGFIHPHTAAEARLAILSVFHVSSADNEVLTKLFSVIAENKGGEVIAEEIKLGRQRGWFR